ncbi:uncharacterized protein LOC134779290 isoform X1 [Penaeus indicus]|uniref:uncharacterized protein LOC134779290 isoform X1 n=1 Tax=Penaeus indicus TaxID=29960 RepID=UPI00300C77D0
MNKYIVGSAVLVTLLGLYVRQGEALMCWDCNSSLDPRCGEFNFDKHTLDTVNCSHVYNGYLRKKEPLYCRKIVQTIQNTVRTVRGCGWLEETKADVGGCYVRTGTKDVMVKYCHCQGDECNGGASLVASLGLATGLLALTKLF